MRKAVIADNENNGKIILILGEYSGFSRNLKSGLKGYGCKVTVFTSGDSFKQLEHDENDLYVRTRNISLFGRRLRGTKHIRGFYNYLKVEKFKRKNSAAIDLILVINPDFLSAGSSLRGYFTLRDCRRLLKRDGKLFLSACGVDIPYLRFGGRMRYWPFSNNSPEDINKALLKLDYKLFNELLSAIEGVIPVMYDFAFPYRELNGEVAVKTERAIPLPIDTGSVRYETGEVLGKVKIFHGRSRDDFKGSEIIIRAMQNILEKYSDKVELMLPEKLPLGEYLEQMSKADIVVDQCRSYSYAMNALYAMAMGKTVLSGNEPECSMELGFISPVINILPDIENIESKLECLVRDPSQIAAYGKAGRECVTMFHDSNAVASKYLALLTGKETTA